MQRTISRLKTNQFFEHQSCFPPLFLEYVRGVLFYDPTILPTFKAGLDGIFLRLPLSQSIILYVSLCPFLFLLIPIARPGWHSVVDLTKRQIIEFDPHSKQLLSTSFHDRGGVSLASIYARSDVSFRPLSTSKAACQHRL